MRKTVAKAMGFSNGLRIKNIAPRSNNENRRALVKANILIDGMTQSLLIAEEAIRKMGEMLEMTDEQVQEMLDVMDMPMGDL